MGRTTAPARAPPSTAPSREAAWGAVLRRSRRAARRRRLSFDVTIADDSVAELLAAHSAPPALAAFAEAYLHRHPLHEDPGRIYAELRGVFELVASRGRKPHVVRAFTPTVAGDGYETGGSVVE